MEYVALFKVIQEGGWVAIIAVMAFFVYRQEKKLEKIETKLDALKDDTVSHKEYYRDISGWRTEINRLDDKIERLILALANALKDATLTAFLKETKRGNDNERT